MILCMTLNPCLDKTLTVPRWRPATRARPVRARGRRRQGEQRRPGPERLGRPAAARHVPRRPVGCPLRGLAPSRRRPRPAGHPDRSPTRVILTVRTEATADQTAFFDPDPAITADEAEAIFHRVEEALTPGSGPALTLSGSSPATATHGLYSDLISLALREGVPVFLDTYGPALACDLGLLAARHPAQPSRGRGPSRNRAADRRRRRRLSCGSGSGTASPAASSPTAPSRCGSCPRGACIVPFRPRSSRQPDRLGRLPARRARGRLARGLDPETLSATRSPARWPMPSSGTPAPSTAQKLSAGRERSASRGDTLTSSWPCCCLTGGGPPLVVPLQRRL